MNAKQLLHYIDQQRDAIQALVSQLDEVQVAFNAQFDQFKAQHDAKLDELTDQVAGHLDTIDPKLRAAIEQQLAEERKTIDARRQKVRDEYLPQRQKAADDLLQDAQTEMAQLRALNPRLDEQEEEFKAEKAKLEAQLAELNEEIRKKSRGLGVVPNFLAILKADRQRQRIIGKLESIGDSLRKVRREWETKRKQTEEHQAELQKQWQMESIAVARLQSELDQLDDEVGSEDLALRRAIRHVLDALKTPSPSTDPDLDAGLKQMIELNIQTDDYQEGLASVGGVIGLARGVSSGMQAIGQSIEGLAREQQMHSAYLKALDFSLPTRVEAFHKQWPALAQQFADEKTIGAHPADFAAAVKPLLDGELSQTSIEAMFNDLGAMIKQATAKW
jgi:DNA repair exonuclease SbcCD ATPase subunit